MHAMSHDLEFRSWGCSRVGDAGEFALQPSFPAASVIAALAPPQCGESERSTSPRLGVSVACMTLCEETPREPAAGRERCVAEAERAGTGIRIGTARNPLVNRSQSQNRKPNHAMQLIAPARHAACLPSQTQAAGVAPRLRDS